MYCGDTNIFLPSTSNFGPRCGSKSERRQWAFYVDYEYQNDDSANVPVSACSDVVATMVGRTKATILVLKKKIQKSRGIIARKASPSFFGGKNWACKCMPW